MITTSRSELLASELPLVLQRKAIVDAIKDIKAANATLTAPKDRLLRVFVISFMDYSFSQRAGQRAIAALSASSEVLHSPFPSPLCARLPRRIFTRW